jgi:hypothetical protein
MRKWVLIVIALVLVACTTNTGTPPPTPPAPVAEFEQVAQQIVQAWHTAPGQDAWTHGLVPLSDVTRLGEGDPGFTAESKRSYLAHFFVPGAAFPEETPRPSRLSFPDGSGMTVSVLDAQTAFGWIGGFKDLRPSPAIGPQPITVIDAALGTMRLRTSRGEIDAPAWIFTTRELRVPILRLAVATESITIPDPGFIPRPPHGWYRPDLVDRIDDTHLSVRFLGGPCNVSWQARAYETNTEVVIGVAVTNPGGNDSCSMVGIRRFAELELSKPLGARTVLGLGGHLMPIGGNFSAGYLEMR